MALSYTSSVFQQVNSPALDIRRYLGVGLQEGVVGVNDMAVAQRGAGANMSVDIGAGEALIQGDTVTNQGRYYVLNDAVTNVTGFSAANATNPRIDRVTLRVRDQFHGDAANDISFQIVTGTATAGATLTNLNGAAAVPGSQLLLANVLIPANATTITTGNIDTTVRPLIYAQGNWQNYTPALTGSTTSPTLGASPTQSGRWAQNGKTIHFSARIAVGGAGFANGSGNVEVSLPTNASAFFTAGGISFGAGSFVDNSTANAYPVNVIGSGSAGKVNLRFNAGAAFLLTYAAPVAWASSDEIEISGTYEAA